MENPTSGVADFFDSDAAEYLEHKYVRRADSFMALRRIKADSLLETHVTVPSGSRFQLLDCGCGPGILVELAARHHFSYWGIDISSAMLALARRQPHNGDATAIRVVRGSVEYLPFRSESFDAAASLGVIEYVPDDNRLVAEMVRVVKPGGYVLIAITNKRSYNLLFEGPLNVLRRSRVAVPVLSALKSAIGLGQFRRAEFEKRRHVPHRFEERLRSHGLTIVETSSWGFNLLPHPFHHLCGGRLNAWANRQFDRSRSAALRRLGEGYLVLCRRPFAGPNDSSALSANDRGVGR